MTFLKLPGISSREENRTLTAGLTFFLFMCALAIIRAARDAYFIKTAGSQNLPVMYIINAGIVSILSLLYAAVADRLDRNTLLNVLAVGAAVLFALAASLESIQFIWMPYAIFALSEAVTLLVLIHFWTFAGDIFDPRESKRIFPIISAGGLLGVICGGLATQFLAVAIGNQGIFLVGAAVLMFCPLAVRAARKAAIAAGMHARLAYEETANPLAAFQLAFRIPLVRHLALLNIPMWLGIYIIEFEFYRILDERYADPDQLSSVLGLYVSGLSLVGLTLQLFVTGRILSRFGAGFIILFYPLNIMAGSVLIGIRALLPGLAWPGLIARITDETLFNSIFDSAMQVLFQATPDEMRSKARAFITGAMEPFSTALAGVALLYFRNIETFYMSLAACFSGFVTFVIARRLRRDYVNALVANLGSRSIDEQRIALKNLNTKSSDVNQALLNSVASTKEDEALFALGLLKTAPDRDEIVEYLMVILPLAGPAVRLEILSFIASARRETDLVVLPELIEGYLDDPDEKVQAAALECLACDRPDLVLRFLSARAPYVRARAIYWSLQGLKRWPSSNPALKELLALQTSPVSAERILAAAIISRLARPALLKRQLELLNDRDESVVQAAIEGLKSFSSPGAVRELLKTLEHPIWQHLTLGTLKEMVCDAPALMEFLEKQIQSKKYPARTRALLIGLLGDLSYFPAIPILQKLLKKQGLLIEDAAASALVVLRGHIPQERARELFPGSFYEAAEHSFHKVCANIKNDKNILFTLESTVLPVALLCDALRQAIYFRENAAINYLQLLDNPQVVRAARHELYSTDHRARSEAVEMIESSSKNGTEFIQVLEYRSSAAIPLEESLSRLCQPFYGSWLRLVALVTAADCRINIPLAVIQAAISSGEEDAIRGARYYLFRNSAMAGRHKLKSRKLNKREALAMQKELKRILFLRSVPLFSDVSGADLQWINGIAHEKQFRPRQIVIREADPGDALYIIMEGSVSILKGKERPVVLDILEEKASFGEMSILDEEPRSATVKANGHCRMLVIQRSDFQRLLIARPHIGLALFKAISQRMRDLSSKLAAVGKAAS